MERNSRIGISEIHSHDQEEDHPQMAQMATDGRRLRFICEHLRHLRMIHWLRPTAAPRPSALSPRP
jgi:hypothetical protein